MNTKSSNFFHKYACLHSCFYYSLYTFIHVSINEGLVAVFLVSICKGNIILIMYSSGFIII